jgi:dihydrolipoamide dehydrogenase
VEVLPQILAGVDARIVQQFRRLVEKEGVVFHTGRTLASVDYHERSLTAHLDDSTAFDCDLMLVSVGRRAQTRGIGLEDAGVVIDSRDHVEVDELLRTANPRIWGAGDCIGGLQLAHLANAEAARAVENALGHHVMPIDRTVVPSCIYTHPEIATVGLTPEEARGRGIEVKVGQARFLGNGKALGEGEPDGVAQLYADARTDVLLGATVMGVHAVEVIHEVGVAMSDALTMDDLGSIIHAHPTVSEVVLDAAEQGEGVAPYLS